MKLFVVLITFCVNFLHLHAIIFKNNVVDIYSLKISHCHSFSDKRHRKARGSGYRVNGKGGTMTQ